MRRIDRIGERTITAADVLAASDAVRVSEPVKGGGTVTVVRSAQLGRAVMTTVGVPDAPSGKVRQASPSARSNATCKASS